MNKVTVEFFHDVICSFCFPMSYRMRQLEKIMPEIEIEHRSFALVKSERDFDKMFGSRVVAKAEILNHWAHANKNDDLHRFNIEKMRKAEFLFPTSMNPLYACKAAYLISGNSGYWDVFDSLQNAFFVETANIEDYNIIENYIKKTGIDMEKWQQYYKSKETVNAVEQDLILGNKYGIESVPCLVVNGKYKINGAYSLATIIQRISNITGQEQSVTEGASCRFTDGKIECD